MRHVMQAGKVRFGLDNGLGRQGMPGQEKPNRVTAQG
jgi:hypothetical protein